MPLMCALPRTNSSASWWTKVVTEAGRDQAIVGTPAVGEHVALGKDVAADDGQQLFFRAVLDHRDVNPRPALVQADDRQFPTRAPAPLAAHAPGAEVALVHFDLPGQLLQRLGHGQQGHAVTQQVVEAVDGAVVGGTEFGGREMIKALTSHSLVLAI